MTPVMALLLVIGLVSILVIIAVRWLGILGDDHNDDDNDLEP